MSEPDLLLTLAEVAVAFAGFASLVGILGHRTAVDDPRILGARMRAMLLTSLLVVAYSLFPLVLNRFALSPAVIWGVSTGGLLISTGAYVAWILSYFRRIRRSDITPTPLQRFVILPALYAMFAGLAVLLASNTVLRSPAIYVAALAVLLLQSGFAFVLIVFSFLPRVEAGHRSTSTKSDGWRRQKSTAEPDDPPSGQAASDSATPDNA